MTDTEAPHLWEMAHPYHCNEENYFRGGCHAEFGSWSDFLEDQGDMDEDMNLVFRFDWRAAGSDWNPGTEDKIDLFIMGQRKGLYRTVSVYVKRSEEPKIRQWLRDRFTHLLKLWTPLSGDGTRSEWESEELPEPEPAEERKSKRGECASCGHDDVEVKRYEHHTHVSGDDRIFEFLCNLCASSRIGNAHSYPNQCSNADIACSIGYATNEILRAIRGEK